MILFFYGINGYNAWIIIRHNFSWTYANFVSRTNESHKMQKKKKKKLDYKMRFIKINLSRTPISKVKKLIHAVFLGKR